MKQLKSTRNNVIGKFTLSQLISATIFAAIVVNLLSKAIGYGVATITGAFYGLLAIGVILIYIGFFRKESTLYKSVSMILYGIDYLLGKTKAEKFKCTETRIKSKFPIDTIHENGMVEFPGKQFGVLFDLYLPNVSDIGHAIFLVAHVELLNSLPEGIVFKTFKFSAIETEKPLVEQVKEAINNPNTTKEVKRHLNTTYDELVKVPGKVGWHAYGFISVGKYKNADKALIGSKVPVEVIMNGLLHANVVPIIIKDQYTSIWLYRQLLSMKKVV